MYYFYLHIFHLCTYIHNIVNIINMQARNNSTELYERNVFRHTYIKTVQCLQLLSVWLAEFANRLLYRLTHMSFNIPKPSLIIMLHLVIYLVQALLGIRASFPCYNQCTKRHTSYATALFWIYEYTEFETYRPQAHCTVRLCFEVVFRSVN